MGEDEEHLVLYVVITVTMALFFGSLVRQLQSQIIPSRCHWLPKPPYTFAVFCIGFLLSVIVTTIADKNGVDSVWVAPFVNSIRSTGVLDPEVILLVLLPPLLYESASSVDIHVFRRVRNQALLMAFPGVLIQLFLVAWIIRLLGYGAGGEPWSWDLSLAFGSIVCATDPVAVVATLHSLGAPEKLSDVIDGESLLNDGSAYVMFLIFIRNVEAAQTGAEPFGVGEGILFFVRLALGGTAWGWATFQLCSEWLLLTENDWRIEVSVLMLTVYGTFAIAEAVLGVSGVLAVVTLGLLMAQRGRYTFSQGTVERVAESSLGLLAHASETVIFFVAGIAVWTAVGTVTVDLMIEAVVLYGFLHATRAATVAVLYPILRRMGYTLRLKEGVIIVYAGLRGAVGLSLGLLVLENELIPIEDRSRVHFLVASTVFLTLLINGTTAPLVYKALRLYPANRFRDVIVRAAIREIETEGMAHIRDQLLGPLSADFSYSRADWYAVALMVPNFADVNVRGNNRLHVPRSAFVDVFSAVIRAEEHAAQAAMAMSTEPLELPFASDAGVHARGAGPQAQSAAHRARHSASEVPEHRQAGGHRSADEAPSHGPALLGPAVHGGWRPDPSHRGSMPNLQRRHEPPALAPVPSGDVLGPPAQPPGTEGAPGGVRGLMRRVATTRKAGDQQPSDVNGGPGPAPFLGERELHGPDAIARLVVPDNDQRQEIVSTLFVAIKVSYAEQYEAKQLSGEAVAALLEATKRGAEYHSEHPSTTAAEAFDVELEALRKLLPNLNPWFKSCLVSSPGPGVYLWRQIAFYRIYTFTEAVGGFIRAHSQVMRDMGEDPLLRRVCHKAVWPALTTAQRMLDDHLKRHEPLVSLQITLLTARRVCEMKRALVESYTETGKLTESDVEQLRAPFDRTLWALDMARFSLTAPVRFAHIIRQRHARRASVLSQDSSGRKPRAGGGARKSPAPARRAREETTRTTVGTVASWRPPMNRGWSTVSAMRSEEGPTAAGHRDSTRDSAVVELPWWAFPSRPSNVEDLEDLDPVHFGQHRVEPQAAPAADMPPTEVAPPPTRLSA